MNQPRGGSRGRRCRAPRAAARGSRPGTAGRRARRAASRRPARSPRPRPRTPPRRCAARSCARSARDPRAVASKPARQLLQVEQGVAEPARVAQAVSRWSSSGGGGRRRRRKAGLVRDLAVEVLLQLVRPVRHRVVPLLLEKLLLDRRLDLRERRRLRRLDRAERLDDVVAEVGLDRVRELARRRAGTPSGRTGRRSGPSRS